jgi:hypothetical protein
MPSPSHLVQTCIQRLIFGFRYVESCGAFVIYSTYWSLLVLTQYLNLAVPAVVGGVAWAVYKGGRKAKEEWDRAGEKRGKGMALKKEVEIGVEVEVEVVDEEAGLDVMVGMGKGGYKARKA